MAEHRYENCRDAGCESMLCRVWREARAEGYRDGHEDGYGEGRADGYLDGFAAGQAATS